MSGFDVVDGCELLGTCEPTYYQLEGLETEVVDGEVLYLNETNGEFIREWEVLANDVVINVGGEDFTDGDLLDCFINIYSKHCYGDMVAYFLNEENGLELVERWGARNMTFNWILYVLWGIPQTLLWFLYIQPRNKRILLFNITSKKCCMLNIIHCKI